jgi:uncharacterized protein YqeY
MLKEEIKNDATQALKSNDQIVSGTLRMLLASIITKEKDKRYKVSKQKPEALEQDLIKESELIEEEIIETISSEIKKRKDAIVLYEKGNRPELAEKEKKEIKVLIKYLPKQLTADELNKLVAEAIEKVGAKEMKDMGKVMAELNPKIKGKADSGEVSKIIKDILSK